MKKSFRKISAVIAGMVMLGASVSFAAAAAFPTGFTTSGGTGVVYGASAASSDQTQATNIANYLSSKMTGGVPTGGDYVILDKASDHLNIGNALNSPFGSTVDDGDLAQVLADGDYTAKDSDEFSYEQSITLGSPALAHFRDSDYEDIIGVTERTPTVGINISDGGLILSYNLTFLDQAESDTASGDYEDFEGSDLPFLGKKFYVSDAKANTSANDNPGTFVLLDSANTGIVAEGETTTIVVDGVSYDVSIEFVDSSETILSVNGKSTTSLSEGETYKLGNSVYVAVRDILSQDYSGGIKKVDFSIGSGKIELASGSDVKINDESITDLKAWIVFGTGEKINQIQIQWKAQDDLFITPESEIELPGFGGIKLSMGDLVRPTEEKLSIDNDGDTSIQIVAPLKDGTADINILAANATGDIVAIGKSTTERLVTSKNGTLIFRKQVNSAEFDKYAVITYNTTDDAESYLLSFKTNEDTGAGRNETTVKNEITGESWTDRKAGDDFKLGNVQFTIESIKDNATDEWVVLSAGTNVNFYSLFTTGGLRVTLPYEALTGNVLKGGIAVKNLTWSGGPNTSAGAEINTTTTAGPGGSSDTYRLYMEGEDKDDNLNSGNIFNFTIDDTTSNEIEVSGVDANTSGSLEIGDTDVFEYYIKDDVAPRILHNVQSSGQDTAEVYYPEANSETYAQVYLSATSEGASSSGGNMVFKDSEKTSWEAMNVIIVGGSCINSAAATALGVSSGTCTDAFTTATSVGNGQFLIQSMASPFTSGKIAVVVAGYSASDTAAAAAYLTNNAASVDTTAGNKYVGVVGATGSSTVTKI
ncbi:MAG: hypothetical protein Q7S56_03635 [Nanoarchaeota archaeon]|nr:hypothetical protein [Nanoarchaeota archaeon]